MRTVALFLIFAVAAVGLASYARAPQAVVAADPFAAAPAADPFAAPDPFVTPEARKCPCDSCTCCPACGHKSAKCECSPCKCCGPDCPGWNMNVKPKPAADTRRDFETVRDEAHAAGLPLVVFVGWDGEAIVGPSVTCESYPGVTPPATLRLMPPQAAAPAFRPSFAPAMRGGGC